MLFTNRLNLRKPAGGSTGTVPGDDPADIDDLNANMELLDDVVGAPGYTSTSRPPTPFDGQIIWESDTGLTKQYRQTLGRWVDLMPGTLPPVTTAVRDTIYPTPGSGPARVNLANAFPRVYNVDKGWDEQYFAQYDDGGGANTPVAPTFGWKPALLQGGLVPISKFTVASTGGTVQKRGAVVEFSGAVDNIRLDDIFTADFSDYRMIIDFDSSTSDSVMALQMRSGGSSLGTAIYAQSFVEWSVGSGPTRNDTSGASQLSLGRYSTQGAHQEYVFHRPRSAAAVKDIRFESNDTVLYNRRGSATIGSTSQFNGVQLGFSQSPAGRIRVYGINGV